MNNASPGEAHLDVWWADLAALAHASETLLTEREIAQREAARMDATRMEFAASRKFQRLLVSRYVDCDPVEVVFERQCEYCGGAQHGKPTVVGSRIDYSISHCGGRLVAVVATAGRVGIDIERVTPGCEELVPLVLSSTERRHFEGLEEHLRCDWFSRMWVRKEATLKVGGRGLSIDPRRISVEGDIAYAVPGQGLELDETVCVVDLTVDEGHVGAVAHSGPIERVRFFSATCSLGETELSTAEGWPFPPSITRTEPFASHRDRNDERETRWAFSI